MRLNPDAWLTELSLDSKTAKSDQNDLKRCNMLLKSKTFSSVVDDLNDVDVDPLAIGALERFLHSRGVNMRHIGAICTETTLLH